MKKAIIILGHGSAYQGAVESLDRLIESLRTLYPDRVAEYCFISKSAPLFPETVDKCVAAGARDITVVPYLLLNGFHVVKDIPEMIEEQKRSHPEINFTYASYLGYDELLVKLLAKRIDEAEA